MSKQNWENLEMSLFRKRGGEIVRIPGVDIQEVAWGTPNTDCQFCGEKKRLVEGRCVECGTPDPLPAGFIDHALVWMAGLMPHARDLFTIDRKDWLEVCRNWPGDMHIYRPDKVVLRLHNCEVIQRTIPNFVHNWGDSVAGYIFVLVEIKCIATLVLPEAEK